MDAAHSNLAAQLLNSSDAKVAAAAKRIFLEAEPTPQQPRQSLNNSTPSILIQTFGTTVSDDIREAASTVAMLDPKKHKQFAAEPTPIKQMENHIVDNSLASKNSTSSPSNSKSTAHSTTKPPPMKTGEKQTVNQDRLKRSRERNKMHARKTRQRKKEHMNNLEESVQDLKCEQIKIKLQIKERNTADILLDTANILVGMFASHGNDKLAADASMIDPKVDALLKRKDEDIPDASKIPDLPALILPGNHSKRRKLESPGSVSIIAEQEYPNDGIDYELLGKDRNLCSPEELDKIRKERNRMHAKRTRDRKRIFMEEMEKIIKQLEAENELLQNHLSKISSDSASSSGRVTPSLNEPAPGPCSSPPTSTTPGKDAHSIHDENKIITQNVQTTNLISSGSSTVSMSPPPSVKQSDVHIAPCSLTQTQQVPSSVTTTSCPRSDMSC